MRVIRTLCAAPRTRRVLWGAGAAPLRLLAQVGAEAHGPVSLWLDRPLAIAPELGCELDWVRFADLVADASAGGPSPRRSCGLVTSSPRSPTPRAPRAPRS